ncbi:Uncharacterised protein [Mycobacteroides abscessus subsp. abscessus]|nr:Uncharacterised protein [Mycobacteroides abscessus subsp. abscessus]
MIRSRPVIPRARRIAVIVASVPVETSRTCSIAGSPAAAALIRSTTVSASSVSPAVEAPKDSPFSAAACTASITAGWRWPSSAGPQEPTRSTYSKPSASVTYGPCASTMNGGTPPTELKARTGELTPPGMTRRDRVNRSSEMLMTTPSRR